MSNKIRAWLDGVPTSQLPLPDRGLEYGDGIFETLLLKQGIPVYPKLHLDRLANGLRALAIPYCIATANALLESAAKEVLAAGWNWASLRLSVTRGAGPRGYTPPERSAPRTLVQIAQLDYDAGVMPTAAILSVSPVRLSSQPLLAGIKHLNRLEQVLAAAAAQREEVDESVMLDQSGNVVSAIAGNLFVLRDGVLLTPPVEHCGVAGTRRRLIMEKLAAAAGVDVLETVVTLPELKAAEEVFYCNSLRGMRPVANVEERQWQDYSLCAALFEQYLRALS